MSHTDWDFNEFLAFFLIYAAHADIDFSDAEKEQIKKIVSPEKFEELWAIFNNMTDYQVLELIRSYKETYFSTPKEKDHLLDEMKNLFNVDGDYSILEKEFHLFLSKLL